MSIFGNWGKKEVSDTDTEATNKEAEDASKEYARRRQDFLDSIRVEPSELRKSESEQKPEDGDSDDDFDEMDNGMEREMERGREDDDDRVR